MIVQDPVIVLAPVPPLAMNPEPSTARAEVSPELWELDEDSQRYDPVQPLDGVSSRAQSTPSSLVVNPRVKSRETMPWPVKVCGAMVGSSMR